MSVCVHYYTAEKLDFAAASFISGILDREQTHTKLGDRQRERHSDRRLEEALA